jgi:hypothetical protein
MISCAMFLVLNSNGKRYRLDLILILMIVSLFFFLFNVSLRFQVAQLNFNSYTLNTFLTSNFYFESFSFKISIILSR